MASASSTALRNRQQRHCCVKGCANQPLKGRKTCGRHGKTRAARPTVKTTPIHLDRVLPTWREFESTSPAPLISTPIGTTERPYLAGVAVRDNGAIIGLPTTRDGFKALLAAWLNRPGRSLADIELLTPSQLPNRDLGMSICNAAATLVAHDLNLAVRA